MLRIRNGKVYDPANGVNGVIRDVCIADGKIVSKGVVRHVAITHVPINPQCPMEVLSKAMCAGGEAHPLGPMPAGNAGALRPESLDSRATNAAGPEATKKKKRKKRLTKSEAIDVMLGRDIPLRLAERIWNLLARQGA